MCAHRQADPVVLTTGEIVACVCIDCIEPLPAGYIEHQRQVALLKAYCTHEDIIELACFGDPVSTYLCARCTEVLDGD